MELEVRGGHKSFKKLSQTFHNNFQLISQLISKVIYR